ncbi:MAG: 3D domain-containing protein [Actinomycetota bacterium]|nr:3D domain-containing protein [Actinomycetota bacterium]
MLRERPLALVLAFVVALLLPLSVANPTASNPLSNAELEIQRQQTRISSLEGQEKSILIELVAIDTSLERNEEELESLSAKLSTTRDRLLQLEGEWQRTNEKLREKTEILNERIKNIYINGEVSPAQFLFNSNDFYTLLKILTYMQIIAANDAELVRSVSQEKERLEYLKDEIEGKCEYLTHLKSKYESRRELLSQKLKEKRNFLDKIRREKRLSYGKLRILKTRASLIRSRMHQLQPPSRGIEARSLRMLATAYCPCKICTGSGNGRTATGMLAGYGVVAVDPRVIPLGTKLYISGYGEAIAGDVGRSIKGYRIDLCFNTHAEAARFGKRWVTVEIRD